MHNRCTTHAHRMQMRLHSFRRCTAVALALLLAGAPVAQAGDSTVPDAAPAAVPVVAPADMPETTIALPSGRAVSFNDVIWNAQGPAGLTVRFRFLEPDLAEVTETTAYDALEADMQFLCQSYAIERISNIGPQPSQIIISISDRPVEFGAADPEATQIFEAYSRTDGICVWEGF